LVNQSLSVEYKKTYLLTYLLTGTPTEVTVTPKATVMEVTEVTLQTPQERGPGQSDGDDVHRELMGRMEKRDENEGETDGESENGDGFDGENDGESAGPAAKKKKTKVVQRTSVTDMLTDEQEAELAEWFSYHPMFWDKERKDFKQADMKERLLSQKAKTYVGFDLVAKNLRTWFATQRSNYGRWRTCKNIKSGSGKTKVTSRNKWVLHNFSWLEGQVSVRTNTSQLGVIASVPKVTPPPPPRK
jgi:hypothetical protein